MDGWDAAGLKAIASSMTAQEGVTAAFVGTSAPIAMVVARSSDVALDANAVLQQLLALAGAVVASPNWPRAPALLEIRRR